MKWNSFSFVSIYILFSPLSMLRNFIRATPQKIPFPNALVSRRWNKNCCFIFPCSCIYLHKNCLFWYIDADHIAAVTACRSASAYFIASQNDSIELSRWIVLVSFSFFFSSCTFIPSVQFANSNFLLFSLILITLQRNSICPCTRVLKHTSMDYYETLKIAVGQTTSHCRPYVFILMLYKL